jgi:hypothetical protein
MLTKLALLSVGLTVALVAADFWTKPAADWTDKEVDLVLSDSPWADRMAVETGQRGNLANADDTKGQMQGNLTTPIVLVWRTALPIRQAIARKSNAPASETEPTVSILLASGFPGTFRADASDAAKLAADTVIKVKGKADIHPTEVQIPGAAAPKGPPGGAPKGGPGGFGKGFGGGNFDLIFAFPKNAGLSADDKEMEFVTKVGKMSIRKKFKLKDMVVNGKLEM